MNLKLVVNFLTIIIILSSVSLSQPRKVMERISTMKKVKLLDVLDLDTKQEEKVLLLYNKYEKLIRENRETAKEIDEKLEDAIRDGDDEKLTQLIDEFLKNRDQAIKIIEQKDAEFKAILSLEKYATYLLFEKRFKEEIGKHLMKRRGR